MHFCTAGLHGLCILSPISYNVLRKECFAVSMDNEFSDPQLFRPYNTYSFCIEGCIKIDLENPNLSIYDWTVKLCRLWHCSDLINTSSRAVLSGSVLLLFHWLHHRWLTWYYRSLLNLFIHWNAHFNSLILHSSNTPECHPLIHCYIF